MIHGSLSGLILKLSLNFCECMISELNYSSFFTVCFSLSLMRKHHIFQEHILPKTKQSIYISKQGLCQYSEAATNSSSLETNLKLAWSILEACLNPTSHPTSCTTSHQTSHQAYQATKVRNTGSFVNNILLLCAISKTFINIKLATDNPDVDVSVQDACPKGNLFEPWLSSWPPTQSNTK